MLITNGKKKILYKLPLDLRRRSHRNSSSFRRMSNFIDLLLCHDHLPNPDYSPTNIMGFEFSQDDSIDLTSLLYIITTIMQLGNKHTQTTSISQTII